MAENLGTGVSYVYEGSGYNYDTVVFQKGEPPLDSELNLVQDLQRHINRRQLAHLASGWMTLRPFYTSPLLSNKFYTQNPSGAAPEYALVNGYVLKVSNTGTSELNVNLINLGNAPTTGSRVNGVFLEVWRALLTPELSQNKPDPVTIVDSIHDLKMVDATHGWAVGDSGLVLYTDNGGQTWNVQLSNTKYKLNGASFATSSIGWVVGDNGTILRTSSAGVQWNVLSSGITDNLNAIKAVSQLVAWAVGNSGTILKTTNGITFLPLSSGVTVNLRGIYFASTLVGWVVGENGTILKTTNGGSSWISAVSGTSANLNSIFFYDLQTGFAVGGGGVILRTSDGGASWIPQSNNIFNGSGYTSLSANLYDVTMSPSLDEYVNGEEVSSQFDGSNKNFTTMHVPITHGDGNGTTTNSTADVVVTVNGTPVTVTSVSGTTGQVVLAAAPGTCDTVKVSYYYKVSSAIFRGVVWAVGAISGSPAKGTVLKTVDLGVTWTIEDPLTSYNINAVAFVNNSKGWLGGDFSVIRHTENGGTTWTVQQSDAVSHIVQRIYQEGNVGTPVYLDDNSIHPDANIETSKRVQVQYRIRLVDNVDPANFPEAGLGSSSIVALGPNASGTFTYQNMGPLTGDYGLWQAQCPNTVDGMAWAIPMFFVNRRNLSDYNPSTNANGSTNTSTGAIRPDLLTALTVVDSDILDVRRLCVIPDQQQLLEKTFSDLSGNRLRTHFFRDTIGGDKYGTEILRLDGVENAPGSIIISNTSLAPTISGTLSSKVQIGTDTHNIPASSTVPSPHSVTASSGVFHYDPAYFSMTYVSTNPLYNGKPVQGTVTGLGTDTITFTFSTNVNTQVQDPGLTKYNLIAKTITPSSQALYHVPSKPVLVRNANGGSSPSFYYYGINEDSPGTILEQWDSGITGRPNYTVGYPGKAATDSDQLLRASTVELHYFVKLVSSQIPSVNSIKIPSTISVTSGASYSIHTISKINNLDSGFSYKIHDETISGGYITIESAPGFPFFQGTTIEVVAYVLSSVGTNITRNGASVNFKPALRGLDTFCRSADLTGRLISTTDATVNVSNGVFLGISSAETPQGLNQPVCWYNNGIGVYNLAPVSVSGFGSSTLRLTFTDGSSRTSTDASCVMVQAMYRQTRFEYPNEAPTGDGLFIGYNYVPYQGITELPDTLSVEVTTKPSVVTISNLGTGGGVAGSPYANPLEHVPVGDSAITSDDSFYNIEPLRFNNFSVDSGFVQVPIHVPADTGLQVTFSNQVKDALGRTYYSTCSRDMAFYAEGLLSPNPRKIYVAYIARVKSSSDGKLMPGEHILVIMSRTAMNDTENVTGYKTGMNSATAVYRLPNKPISKV